jgi:GntR family transcriptional regulator
MSRRTRSLTLPALDKTSAVPLHHQLRTSIAAQLERSQLLPGDRLPPERELAEKLGISVAPVRQAFLDLARQGRIVRMRARGSFVTEHRYEENVSALGSFSDVMRRHTSAYETHAVVADIVTAPRVVRDTLAINGSKAFRLLRVAHADGVPVALLDSYLSPERFSGLPEAALSGRSLYAVLNEGYGVTPRRATNTIEVAYCTKRDADLLAVAPRSVSVQVTSVTFDEQDVPFEHVRVAYRPDRFRLTFDSS